MIEVITDSVGPHSPRLTTWLWRLPSQLFALIAEDHGHDFSFTVYREGDVAKNLTEVRSDELRAAPVWWGKEQKGMQSGDELDDTERDIDWAYRDEIDNRWFTKEITKREAVKRRWKQAALKVANEALEMQRLGAHKSIVNRLLEPFLHINVVATSCEPGLMNFFGLRLDKAAQPEIRVLAEAMWAAWNESTPTKLESGQWHLPFLGPYCVRYNAPSGAVCRYPELTLELAQRISVARCARVSYLSHETGKRSTIEEDLALYDRLVGSQPMHASPAEHIATPDDRIKIPYTRYISGIEERYTEPGGWLNPEQHGNLPGWIQLRKTLPGEAAAPLPEGYAR